MNDMTSNTLDVEIERIARARDAIHAANIEYMDAYKAFGRAFRKKRESLPKKLREVARELGCSAAYLSNVELGRRAPNNDILSYFS